MPENRQKRDRRHAPLSRDRAAETAEERYRAFAANSSEGIWRLEFDPPLDTSLPVDALVELAYRHGVLLECNDAMARMHGLQRADELIGATLESMLPSSNPAARASIASLIEAGYRVSNIESTERDVTGGIKHFVNSMTGVVERGRLLGIWGTQRDVTDRKRETEASAYLAAIVASSDDAIIAKDLNGIIRSCNASAERLFGYTSSELIGRPVRILIPADRQQEEDLILGRIRRGERIEHFETVRITKDGHLIDISLTVSPVRDGSGAIIGVSKVARDITERRRMEAERQSAAADRERLLEAERVARAEAERANRIKDEFVAMVSHELRTPLNAILGWTQLMMRDRNDPAVLARGLDVISRNTRVQAQLIADLLDISRIVSGKLRLETLSVNLREIVDDAIEAVEGEAEAKGVALAMKVDDDIGPVAGDPARLQQVIWNLLSNAIKFTPRGGHISVSLTENAGAAEIAVADSGVGIRADVLPHVFDRFHQADRSITRRFGGLGLGLSIVKHLVELHGGTVLAESSGEGEGSVFTIRLPIPLLPHLHPTQGPAPPEEPTETIELDSLRVLLVEDEPDTLEYLQRLLADHGAIVFAAPSAAEALVIVRRERPEMLISDIGLPEMDGYDLMQQIRREYDETMPAIALTAYARSEDRTRAFLAGFQAHIAKPAEPAEVLATIASLANLRHRSSRPQKS